MLQSSGEVSSTSAQPMSNDMCMPPPAVPDNQHNVASPNDTQLMDGCDGAAANSSTGDEATPMPHVLNIYIVRSPIFLRSYLIPLPGRHIQLWLPQPSRSPISSNLSRIASLLLVDS